MDCLGSGHGPPASPPARAETRDRVLVIMFGSIRGGEETWKTANTHLLLPNHADLALCIGEPQDRNSSLLERARYVWEVPEGRWLEAYDNLWGNGTAAAMLPLTNSGLSGPIQWFLKHKILTTIWEHRLDLQYDRFVVTRTSRGAGAPAGTRRPAAALPGVLLLLAAAAAAPRYCCAPAITTPRHRYPLPSH